MKNRKVRSQTAHSGLTVRMLTHHIRLWIKPRCEPGSGVFARLPLVRRSHRLGVHVADRTAHGKVVLRMGKVVHVIDGVHCGTFAAQVLGLMDRLFGQPKAQPRLLS